MFRIEKNKKLVSKTLEISFKNCTEKNIKGWSQTHKTNKYRVRDAATSLLSFGQWGLPFFSVHNCTIIFSLENIKVNLKSRLALGEYTTYDMWLSSQKDKCGCTI